MHGLDASTCPCGCFEHGVSIADMEDSAFPGWAEDGLNAERAAQASRQANLLATILEQEKQEEQEAGLAAKAVDRRRWIGAVAGCLVLALALYVLA